MSDTGIFWIRDDFRIENNPALSFATQNHINGTLQTNIPLADSVVMQLTVMQILD